MEKNMTYKAYKCNSACSVTIDDNLILITVRLQLSKRMKIEECNTLFSTRPPTISCCNLLPFHHF